MQKSLARSIEIRPALHPIPPRLRLFMFPLSLIIAESDGVGQKRLQFTIRIPMSLGFTVVLANSSSIAPNITSSASFLASAIEGLGGLLRTASGK
uniref:Uncharacterized protein n=1 Tax=Cajanus cajan TaxID=3821 RepID=A0A151QRZ4_CAJCA|nr:hypothetical protein KK1_046095 [Cajanus cajan]